MPGNRNWVFTLNANEDEGEHITWVVPNIPCPLGYWLDAGKIDYLVCQVERVAHVHIQGYIQFNRQMTLAGLKKVHAGAHWEVRRGTHAEAKAYAMKKDTRVNGPWELGHETGDQGKRNDLKQLKVMVDAGKSHLEILEETEGASARFEKQINYMKFCRQETLSDRQLQGVRVIVLYGATGTGKTYAAINYIADKKDYYICEPPSNANGRVWFSGYDAQRVLILDEFNGSFCDFRWLLRLLDPYKLKVEYKGGFCWACWTTVVITTNLFPTAWYTGVDLSPLRRRLTAANCEIRKMESQGVYKKVDWEEHEVDTDFVSFALPAMGAQSMGSTQVVPDSPVASTSAAAPALHGLCDALATLNALPTADVADDDDIDAQVRTRMIVWQHGAAKRKAKEQEKEKEKEKDKRTLPWIDPTDTDLCFSDS